MQEKARLILEDLEAVVKEAKRMGCSEIKAFNHVPLENVELIVEALKKILSPAEEKIAEARSLRWLSNQFPFDPNPKDDTDKMCNCIHIYCKAGADKIEQLAALAAENKELKQYIERMERSTKNEGPNWKP